eukprot:378626_1
MSDRSDTFLKWKIVKYDTFCVESIITHKISIHIKNKTTESLHMKWTYTNSSHTRFPRSWEKADWIMNYDTRLKPDIYANESHIDTQYIWIAPLCYTVDEFIQNMIIKMSKPTCGNKYKLIIDKYNDKNKYSFVALLDSYQGGLVFSESKLIGASREACKIFIIDDDRELLNDVTQENEIFPVIVEPIINSKSCFPKKVWMTRKTKLEEIVKKYTRNNPGLQFDKCIMYRFRKKKLTDNNMLKLTDNIYESSPGRNLWLYFSKWVPFKRL